jgi:large repetitive protein
LTATVTATGAGAPTGSVTFLDGATTLGTGTLNANGQATLTTATFVAGKHTLTAMYAGDANYGPSTSVGTTILIARPFANVSAASYRGNQFAREQIIAAFGTNLATGIQAATTLPLPTTLAGTRVSVKDSAGVERPAPLFFVSPNQVNYLLPADTALGPATATIIGGGNDENVALAVLPITTVAPGIFTGNANGAGVAAAQILRIQPDGSQSYEPVLRLDPVTNRFVAIPIEFGPPSEQLFLLLYCTGLRYRASLSNVTATISNVNVQATFAGAQGSLAGLDQVNLRLTPNLSVFPNPALILTVDGVPTNTVQISFR